MIRRFARTLGIGALAGFASSAVAQELAEPDWRAAAAEHGWYTDYEKAQDEARRSGKPMMIVFRCIP